MFEYVIVNPPPRTEYVPYEKTVIEKRVPTDESIRIYEEIKEKAYKSILDTIEINDNSFNVKAIVFTDMHSMGRVCKFIFTINGKEIKGELAERGLIEYDKDIILRKILTASAELLAVELIKLVSKQQPSLL